MTSNNQGSINLPHTYSSVRNLLPKNSQIIIFHNNNIVSPFGTTVDKVSYVWDEHYLQFLNIFQIKSDEIFNFQLIDGFTINEIYQLDYQDLPSVYALIRVHEKNPFVLWSLSDVVDNRIIKLLKKVNWDSVLELQPVKAIEKFRGTMILRDGQISWKNLHLPKAIAEFIQYWRIIITFKPVQDFIDYKTSGFFSKFFKFTERVIPYSYFKPRAITFFALYDPNFYQLQKNYIKFILYYLRNEINIKAKNLNIEKD